MAQNNRSQRGLRLLAKQAALVLKARSVKDRCLCNVMRGSTGTLPIIIHYEFVSELVALFSGSEERYL